MSNSPTSMSVVQRTYKIHEDLWEIAYSYTLYKWDRETFRITGNVLDDHTNFTVRAVGEALDDVFER